MTQSTLTWLVESEYPWIRFLTMKDLLECPHDNPELLAAHRDMVKHPLVMTLIDECRTWHETPLKNHKAAVHPLHKIVLLADLGLQADDDIRETIENILSQQDDSGSFRSLLLIPKVFGGSNLPEWVWMLCDAPSLLYALSLFGLAEEEAVRAAVEHLASLVEDTGWRCVGSIPKFRGPGKKDDPCPYANLIAMKALSLFPEYRDSAPCRAGAEMLLHHWEIRKECKYYLFGMGTDFRRIKFPMVWYDLLHVVDVLSRFSWVIEDKRFVEMFELLLSKADTEGRFTPESVWMAFKGFDFAQKKIPSPTLTLMVERIKKRL